MHSFINECKGLEGISPAVISYIISGSRDTLLEHLVLEDIPDPCLRQILKEVYYDRDEIYSVHISSSTCTFKLCHL